MKISCIYKITSCANGKIYIGSASDFSQRTNVHIHRLRKNNHANKKLQNHFNKYGEQDLLFSILEPVLFKDMLLEREQYFINTLKPEFNILKVAGSLIGYKFSIESRKKMSLTHSNRPRKKASDVARENMRIAHIGKKLSPESIRKRTLKQRGVKRSDEFKKNISLIHSKKIIDISNNKIFIGRRSAALSIGINIETLGAMLTGRNPNKTNFRYVQSPLSQINLT
jgi:group I intron endonuclease